MARAHAIAESGHWGTDAHPVQIEYLLSVVERIRADAVQGFCRFPRGGIEVGGILFGNTDGNLIRILASRPVESEYAFGPSYVLSEKDESAFRRVLEGARTDPELTGLAPVGWYHSHTRSQIFLSPQDLGIHDRYFPGRRQIALVVRPEPFGTAQAGFFVREPDGSIRCDASYSEFVIHVPGRVRAQAPVDSAQPRAAEPVREVPPPAVRPEAPAEESAPPPQFAAEPDLPRREPRPFIQEPRSNHDEPARRRVPPWVWLAVAVVLAICGSIALPRLERTSPPAPRTPLALRVLDVNGRLRIVWDRGVVRQAKRASLDITDGTEHISVPFDARLLREGSIVYTRRSDNVEVRLRVERPGGPQEEFVRFLGRPAEPPPASAPPVSPEPPALQAPERASPEGTEEARRSLPQPVQATRQPAPAAAAEAKSTPAEAKPAPRVFNLARLQASKPPAPKETALPAPPVVETRGSPAIQYGAPSLPSAAIRPAQPPPPAPVPSSPAKPAYTGPSSGRIIWTGGLTRGASVWIDGRQSSSGTATGELPGVPVRVSVHPADLSSRGLTVFTASGRALREPPGIQNGWNPTAYTIDPRRAGELLVLESPSQQNGWKKLVFRNDTREVSVIVIDWKLAE